MARKSKPTACHGALRVWWIPQVPGQSFVVPVKSVVEARLLLDALADYDAFLLQQNVRRDYSNVGGLSVFDANDKHDGPAGSWVDWQDTDCDDIDSYELADLRRRQDEDDLPVWDGLRATT